MPIEVSQLSYTYMPGTPFQSKALSDISFTIGDGEFVGIIGHTGSGKSTLVQHLNGLIRPMQGEVLVDGLSLSNKDTNMRDVRQRVGLVFQYPEYQLFEETVEKDIAFGPRNLGLGESEIKQRVLDAIAQVGLDEAVLAQSPFELSGGQKRRVAIAGVLAMKPSVLVMDEPTAGLDPKGREGLLSLMQQLHDADTTMVMVSHSMEDVARMCRRILVINHGRLAMDGTPEQVFARGQELNDMGLGLPVAAQLAHRLRALGWDVPQGLYTLKQLEPYLLRQLGKGDTDV